jgi:8-oxo-dGTP diphosphatase
MKETTLCYIFDGPRVLLMHRDRKENDPNQGKWIGIGGKLEVGETPLEGMLREVFEETGLVPSNPRYFGAVHFISDIYDDERMHLFVAHAHHGTMHQSTEGHLAWISREMLETLPMWEGDRHFLERILSGQPFEEMTLRYRGERLVHVSVDGVILPLHG